MTKAEIQANYQREYSQRENNRWYTAMTSKALRKAYSGCTVAEIEKQSHVQNSYYRLQGGSVTKIEVAC